MGFHITVKDDTSLKSTTSEEDEKRSALVAIASKVFTGQFGVDGQNLAGVYGGNLKV